MKNVVILGATGSIGTQTLDVIRTFPQALRAVGLSAHSRWQTLCELAVEHKPNWATITDTSVRGEIEPKELPEHTELLWGEAGIERMVTDAATDVVVAAMVGAAGLRGTVAALRAGKQVALANKETLVVGGPLVTELARKAGKPLIPVDSEHSAIFQCLQAGRASEVERIILTASGGPFRATPLTELEWVSADDALQHPTWNMGPKITIDSATMMNKALEIIEAHWLFGLSAEQIDVVIHPQSMVHSMVEFVDGSVVAQVSPPDMRLPIQYALSYPERWRGPARRLNLAELSQWEFSTPDLERYPALELGYLVVKEGGTCGAALNAVNEVAVQRFLREEIRFVDIVAMCKEVLRHHPYDSGPSFDDLMHVDHWARQEAFSWNRSSVSSRS